jgi:hypothetical protein
MEGKGRWRGKEDGGKEDGGLILIFLSLICLSHLPLIPCMF